MDYGMMTSEEKLTHVVLLLERNLRICHELLYQVRENTFLTLDDKDEYEGLYTAIEKVLDNCGLEGKCPVLLSIEDVEQLESDLEIPYPADPYLDS